METGINTQTNLLETSIDSVEQESRNEQAFEALLGRMRDVAHSERDKGDLFERLMCQVLAIASPYSERFSKVQLYKDWATEHPECVPNARDIGIDLVATLIPSEWKGPNGEARYVAIQCKFYDQDSSVPKSEVDSFLSASSTKFFVERLFVATNKGWSANTEQEVKLQEKPTNILDLEKLKHLPIDWQQYLKDGTVKRQAKRKLRPYQEEAISNVILGFKTYDRGKLIMACGTGKTFTSLKLAEKQVGKQGLVLFLVPSLALLSQTLDDWAQQSSDPMTAIPVCSDATIRAKQQASARLLDPEDDSPESFLAGHELSYPATTDAKSLAAKVTKAFEQYATNTELGLTVVFSTYQSLDVVHEAQDQYDMAEFDLIICDEAHRTAGAYLFNDLKEKEKKKASKGKKGKLANIEPSEEDFLTPQCDEAPEWDIEAESLFTRVHNADYIHGRKRLYMTATPKVYGDAPKKQESLGDAVLYSMDDEKTFGPVFYSLNFDKAVKLGCLVDYQVIILVCDPQEVPYAQREEELSQTQRARMIGSWKALEKYGLEDNVGNDKQPMKRAVAFAQRIDLNGMPLGRKRDMTVASKQFAAQFNDVVTNYRQHVLEQGKKALIAHETPSLEYQQLSRHEGICDCRHIDGSMSSVEKSDHLCWLREEPEEGHCKILFNVRCLCEGVDVPSLDGVVFLSPRKSMVEVVQIVGRVMRRAPNKERGYVVIPVVTTNLNAPEEVLANNPDYKVVWQVLQALRSINPNHVLADASLGKLDPRIHIICWANDQISHKDPQNGQDGGDKTGGNSGNDGNGDDGDDIKGTESTLFDLNDTVALEEHIKATIIKKVGNRREWEDWAKDVGKICSRQVDQIKVMVGEDATPENRKAFADFKTELAAATRVKLSDNDVVEMLAQHIVIKPVLDELFRGYPFTEKNAIASAMTKMLERLDADGLTRTNDELRGFYDSVGFRMQNVTSVSDRQKVIVDLFDRFFKVAFPKQQDKLGIVYTPIEVVDFMIHSVNDILQKEFGCSFSTRGVHVLDPFTGTGTFIARLLTSGLIIPEELDYKYEHELHAFEILPLAYYIASINIESVHNELYQEQHHGETLPVEAYKANNITVLTDTFSSSTTQTELTELTILSDNIKRRKAVESMDLRVIIGNPPYSVGQDSIDDDNQNEEYPELDDRIAKTYVAKSKSNKVSTKKSLYDSYIRAFRWASDKIKDRGVIAFITNSGWLDTTSANGMRRCLSNEFSSVYIFDLKGKQKYGQTKEDGGNIFGNACTTGVCISFLVKNPDSAEHGHIHFTSIPSFLSTQEKREFLVNTGSITSSELKFTKITPDSHGDWFNQRRDDFGKFISVDGKKNPELGIFANYSAGIVTTRDAWSINSSQQTIASNFNRCIPFYNNQVDLAKLAKSQGKEFVKEVNFTSIKWSEILEEKLEKGIYSDDFSQTKIVPILYRPFVPQWMYFDAIWVYSRRQMPNIFPFNGALNRIIIIGKRVKFPFSCIIANNICDYGVIEGIRCFPRYLYRPLDKAVKARKSSKATGQVDLFASSNAGEHDASNSQNNEQVVINGYVREDAIKPEAVAHFRAAYAGHEAEIDADSVFYYIYGIFHNKDYRETYANNLQKELPRIPRVATFEEFKAFEVAGRKLAELHVNYEQVKPYDGCTITGLEECADADDFRVTKLKYVKVSAKEYNKTQIIYNNKLSISNIPLEVQDYVINKKSALDSLIEQCGVSVDNTSQIVNDFNNIAEEKGDPQYILHLILRVITVSLETNKIVASLPALRIHPLDQ